MRCRIGDNEYDFDFRMTVAEAIFLQEKAFCTVLEFGPALQKADARALAVLMYMLKKRNKEVVKWDDILKMDVFSLQMLPDPEQADAGDDVEDEVAESAGDPT
ncbi:hypothetical protein SAMN05421837_107375 [Amycolatopsis pretoriensis]|uniref:Uncharacterized protein n=1 Tax=Amycolatopsis pretoriensis TaxID=218821 RepID=A0A1H5RAH0_9PSEU|nr:hypothetical protein [Amycolatopsis pretoriensis]SEF34407.1 hypothetical protein SAMN05421837_107375 [Amycolatopsis pretoriensis]